MKRVTIAQFYSFLDNLGLFGEFCSEFYKIRNGRGMTLLEYNYFSTISPARFVSAAFVWDDTDSGYDFWKDVHFRWLRRINCNNQK